MSENKNSFWSSMPGILTGLATLITALVGLYSMTNKPDEPRNTDENVPALAVADLNQTNDRNSSRATSVDLSGLWDRAKGGRLSFEQQGNTIKAIFVEPPPDAVSRGMKRGDTAFEAVVQGRAIEGTSYIVFSLRDQSNCPNARGNRPSRLRLEISEDGNTLEGNRTDYKVLPDCQIANLPPRQLKYVRVAH